MNGMPSAVVISFRRTATSTCSASDSTTHGPAIRKNGCWSPTSNPQSFIARSDRSSGHLLDALGLVLERGFDEGLEERMPAPRRRLELRMELHAEEPRVHALRQLDHLGQLLALGQRRDHEAGLGEPV